MAVRIENHAEPLPGYRLVERLGGGGFGEVWKCIAPGGLHKAINHHLPGDILVREVERVPPTFDALHQTSRKRYQYLIWNAQERPVFFNDLAWHRWQALDLEEDGVSHTPPPAAPPRLARDRPRRPVDRA